jgi:hypothetical protein
VSSRPHQRPFLAQPRPETLQLPGQWGRLWTWAHFPKFLQSLVVQGRHHHLLAPLETNPGDYYDGSSSPEEGITKLHYQSTTVGAVMNEIYELAAKGDARALAAVRQYEAMQTAPRR